MSEENTPPPTDRPFEHPDSPIVKPMDLPDEEEYEAPKNVVIIGGGIVGATTAYYLTRAAGYDPSKMNVTLLEASSIAAGASGNAGGLLALDWHGTPTASLAGMSYALHRTLAEEHNGRRDWGYREITTVDLKCDNPNRETGNGMGDYGVKSSSHWGLDNVPEWVDGSQVRRASVIGVEETTSQVHPRLFTRRMVELAQEKGCEVTYGLALEILFDGEGEKRQVKGVRYRPRKQTSKQQPTPLEESVPNGPSGTNGVDKVKNGEKGDEKTEGEETKEQKQPEEILAADCVVVAAGPWTSRVLEEIPITSQRAHSITIRTSEPVSAHALFTTIKTKSGLIATPEIYSRPDEVYVCGETDTTEPLPEYASDVAIIESRCDALKTIVSEISDQLKQGTVECKQACYLPYCGPTGPAIGWVPDMKGVLVAAGHSVWGICNGPGTGLVVSEMIMDGKAESADISMLDPSRFF